MRTILPTVLVIALVAGCNNSTAPTPGKSPAQPKNVETEGEKCRDRLAAAIRRVHPETLSLQDKPERAINGLNAWIATCASEKMDELKVGDATLKLVDSNPRTTAGRFTANDAAYIRDCIMLRDLSNAIWERVDADDSAIGKDASRVNWLFDWLVRNVSLINADEKRVAMGLFDALLTGRGSSEDRAWIFVEALRQQHIHSAFLTFTDSEPAEDGGSLETANWLVVVNLEEGSAVFDMVSGTKVTTSGEDVGIEQLLAHERWKECVPKIVAQHATFSPRMYVLQNQLASADAAVLFEELAGGVSEITPLTDLIAEAGNETWTASQVVVWDYPEDRTIAAASHTEAETTAYQKVMQSFDAPFERDVISGENFEELTTVPEELSKAQRKAFVESRLMEEFTRMTQSSEDMFGKPSKRLLKARIRQISGTLDKTVIQQLQQIRIASMEEKILVAVPEAVQRAQGLPPIYAVPLPELIREVNQSSTGDALYWTAMCQIDRGEVGAAMITLQNYRRQYPNGRWHFPSMLNQAVALIVQERFDEATELLTTANVPENPEHRRAAAMLASLAN